LKYPPQSAGIKKQLDQFHNAAQLEPPTKRQEQRTVRVIGMPAANVGKCREEVETLTLARAIEVSLYPRRCLHTDKETIKFQSGR
jgi:hypothetical protein